MFIPQILLLTGLVGILVMVLHKIPALLKLPDRPKEILPPASFFSRLRAKIKGWQYSEYRSNILSWFEKALRKVRLLFLKVDNFFLNNIKKARERSRFLKIRSKAWLEHKRLKKIHKLEIMQNINKAELIDRIKTAKEIVKGKIGESHFGEEDLSKKEKGLVKEISRDPKNPKLYKDLGSLYLTMKNFKDAQQAFEQVLKLDPSDTEAKERLEKIKVLREPAA